MTPTSTLYPSLQLTLANSQPGKCSYAVTTRSGYIHSWNISRLLHQRLAKYERDNCGRGP